jgi:hypothetical protein
MLTVALRADFKEVAVAVVARPLEFTVGALKTLFVVAVMRPLHAVMSIRLSEIFKQLMVLFEDRWRSAKSFKGDALKHSEFRSGQFQSQNNPILQC